ncbi:MAG: Gfo/Idh/MocA family protein, partial [Daejeonella sp.]
MKSHVYQPINTGLLAYGMSGRIFHAPFIHTHPGFRLNAVTERHDKKANQFYPDIKSYKTTDELINEKSIELVVVNTPNNTHFEYAKQALMAGKHVLVEKPFTTSLSEAKELFKLGKKVQRKVMAYQNRRWDSDFKSVKNIVESGKLGKLIEVHF